MANPRNALFPTLIGFIVWASMVACEQNQSRNAESNQRGSMYPPRQGAERADQDTGNQGSNNQGATTRSGSTALNSADSAFAQQAMQSGAREVALSRLALERSQNPRVRSFAEKMISDHEAASRELQTIASVPAAPAPSPPQELTQLGGNAFDRSYMQLMVADHEKAVALFQEHARHPSNSPLSAFAAGKLPTLRMHLTQAQEISRTMGQTSQND